MTIQNMHPCEGRDPVFYVGWAPAFAGALELILLFGGEKA